MARLENTLDKNRTTLVTLVYIRPCFRKGGAQVDVVKASGRVCDSAMPRTQLLCGYSPVLVLSVHGADSALSTQSTQEVQMENVMELGNHDKELHH